MGRKPLERFTMNSNKEQKYEGKLKRNQSFYRVRMGYPRKAPMMGSYKGVHQQARDYGQSYEITLEQFLLNSRTANNNNW